MQEQRYRRHRRREKAEPGTLWLLRPNQISGSVREPLLPFLPAATLAHDELCSNSNSNFHRFFICSSGIIRLGFVSFHSLALQVRIYRISCCRVIRSWWYPSLLSRLKCISFRCRYTIWDLHKPRSSHNYADPCSGSHLWFESQWLPSANFL